MTEHADVREIVAWAKNAVFEAGCDEQLLLGSKSNFSEADLLRELAWVILCSGFKERVVRKCFSKISLCFLDWVSSAQIVQNRKMCVATALDVFGSRSKIEAIAGAAKIIHFRGFDVLAKAILSDPLGELKRFPFVGEITSFHLAKNLGFDFAKPDRHLQRLSQLHGYDNVQEFCERLALISGEPVHLLDTLLWRVSEMGMSDKLVMKSVARG